MTMEIVWEGKASTEEDVNKAVESAHEALQSWSCLPIEQREHHLLKFQECLKNKNETFAEAISIETGKPLWESKSEVDSMIAKSQSP